MAHQAIELCKEVGMGSAYYVKRFWHDAHQIAAQMDEHAEAEHFYNNAYGCALLCEGGKSPEGVRLRRYTMFVL